MVSQVAIHWHHVSKNRATKGFSELGRDKKKRDESVGNFEEPLAHEGNIAIVACAALKIRKTIHRDYLNYVFGLLRPIQVSKQLQTQRCRFTDEVCKQTRENKCRGEGNTPNCFWSFLSLSLAGKSLALLLSVSREPQTCDNGHNPVTAQGSILDDTKSFRHGPRHGPWLVKDNRNRERTDRSRRANGN